MDVNAYGPLFVVQALRGHLREGSHVRALSKAPRVIISIHQIAVPPVYCGIVAKRNMMVLFGHPTTAGIIFSTSFRLVLLSIQG